MSKQDRQGARTPADLERKYKFGKSFAEVMGFASDAQDAAREASSAAASAAGAVSNLDGRLDQEEIFSRLTNNGEAHGIYRDPETGEIYINASYLASGVISSADGTVQVDLLNNVLTVHTENAGFPGKVEFRRNGITCFGWDSEAEDYVTGLTIRAATTSRDGITIGTQSMVTGAHTDLYLIANQLQSVYLGMASNRVVITGNPIIIGGREVEWKDNGDGTYTLLGR